MTPVQLGWMAAVGLACLASSVLLVRTTPRPAESLLDSVYN